MGGKIMMKAGVIGLGIGKLHCEAYAKAKGVQLVAVCDLVEERLVWARNTYNVDTYKDVDEFLRREDIHMVSICTPDFTHVEIAKKVARSSKHILLEKPMALTLADCDIIIREVKKAGVICSIHYEMRLHPVIKEIKELIKSNRLGKIAAFSIYDFRQPFARDKVGKWIQKENLCGGMLVQETCHWFDLFRFLSETEIAELQCYKNDWVHKDFDFEDIAYINCRFKDGSIGQISHTLAGFDDSLILWIVGTKGTIWALIKLGIPGKASFGKFGGFVTMKKHSTSRRPNREVAIKKFGKGCQERLVILERVRYYAEFEVTGKKPILSSMEDGKISLALSLAAKKSARTDTVIHIRPFLRR